jgi:N-acetylglutamate synthase-like GNAT family acetyltransferase
VNKEHDYSCRTFRYEDEEGVKQLVKNAFGGFLEGDFWDWKYKLNPNFNPSLVMVAEKNGVIIGCTHWLLKTFRLSPSLETKAMLGADIAVHPEYRGKGVGKSLLRSLRSSEVMRNEQPSIAYAFANPSLTKHFHTPAVGYIPAPDRTVLYFKILNWKKLEDSIRVLNEQIAAGEFKERLSKFELKVLFKISNTPQLCFRMTEKGITVEEKERNCKNADVTIVGDLAMLQKVRTAKKRRWSMFSSLLTRKLKIKVRPIKLFTLYRNMWLFEEILSRKIT